MSKLKTRYDGKVNITVDPEAVTMLDEYAASIEPKLGFKPTRSQALKHLIRAVALAAALVVSGCMSPGFYEREAEINQRMRANYAANDRLSAWYAANPDFWRNAK